MCGLVGFVIKKNRNLDYFDHLAKMTSALKHRGPDDLGLYFDDNKKIGMGHTRLSIQDLSENGSQPMNSKSKRIILVFNGEIYNHLELRKKINSQFNINWTGTSDTETLIECIEKYGILKTLELIKGMFAFSFFDRKTNNLPCRKI